MEALRQLDRFRQWISLDDERRCLQCGAIITGRDIALLQRPGETGPFSARCPTPGCVSIPLDWALVSTDHLFAARTADDDY